MLYCSIIKVIIYILDILRIYNIFIWSFGHHTHSVKVNQTQRGLTQQTCKTLTKS